MKGLEERVDASAIRNKFLGILSTGHVTPKTTFYWLIQQRIGMTPGNARKILSGFA